MTVLQGRQSHKGQLARPGFCYPDFHHTGHGEPREEVR